MSFRQNAAKPEGFGGRLMVMRMNNGHHAALSRWGLAHLMGIPAQNMLELGCGGGANVARLLSLYPEGKVTGIDYAEISVQISRRRNRRSIKKGRCKILQENVRSLSFADASFDLATAFETIYFWPSILESLKEVRRVLQPGGHFLICNETDGTKSTDREIEEEIKGMTMYPVADILDLLYQAGFSYVRVGRHPTRHWIVFLAEK